MRSGVWGFRLPKSVNNGIMIDIGKIYDRIFEDAQRRPSQPQMVRTVDGGWVHVEYYSYRTPIDTKQILKEPIDLNNELKFVRTETFDASGVRAPVLERVPVAGCFGKVRLGEKLEMDVDYGEPVRIYENGLASVRLQITEEYYDACEKLNSVLNGLPDFETEKKTARDTAREKWMSSHEFDPDSVYRVSDRDGSKKGRHNREEAIKKEKANRKLQVSAAERGAEQEVIASRNGRLTASGLNDSAIRRILNGSLDAYEATLYWYPTTLDLVRMFEGTVPTKCFIKIDENDDEVPASDSKFSQDLLAESFDSVSTGDDAFNDIRDGLHAWPTGGMGPFPRVKPNRWKNMLDFPPFIAKSKDWGPDDPPGIFVDDAKKVWTGWAGAVWHKIITKTPGFNKTGYNILTSLGVRIIYPSPDSKAITAFFMTPSALAKAMKDAVNMPENIEIKMIKKTFENMEILRKEAEMFRKKGGTRRYIA